MGDDVVGMVGGFGKDVIVGLSAIFLLLVAAILAASSRLVLDNWSLFIDWKMQDREAQLRLALYYSIPSLMAGLFWMRSIAIWHYAVVYGIPAISLAQMFIYMPFILTSLSAMSWYVCNRAFGYAMGDRVWLILMISGFVLGVVTTFMSWII